MTPKERKQANAKQLKKPKFSHRRASRVKISQLPKSQLRSRPVVQQKTVENPGLSMDAEWMELKPVGVNAYDWWKLFTDDVEKWEDIVAQHTQEVADGTEDE